MRLKIVTIVILSLALIFLGAAFFIYHFYLSIAAAVFICAGIVLRSVPGKTGEAGGKVPKTPAGEQVPGESGVAVYTEEILEKVRTLEEKNSSLREQIRAAEGKNERLFHGYLLFKNAVPIMDKLSGIVINESEKTTVNVTDSIFTVAETSKEAGIKIKELLTEMFEGDKSLKNISLKLSEDIQSIDNLIDRFDAISSSYKSDMRVIENTVSDINASTEDITDLAEQTNILAINASIEAARVGDKGRGFAVIASEVQALASHSKDIAEKINTLIAATGKTVDESFSRQSEHIANAIEQMKQSQGFLSGMAGALSSQVNGVVEGIKDSEKLSDSVTKSLNEVITSMQFQDITRQVLEHIISLIGEIEAECREQFTALGYDVDTGSGAAEEEVNKRAERLFTVREEWDALGFELEEKLTENEGNSRSDNFDGDVTLF
jgi:methyl-accepting chemotaxis protein